MTSEPSAYDELVKSTDHLSDDELAERIAQHPDRDLFLAVLRRTRGDSPKAAHQERRA